MSDMKLIMESWRDYQTDELLAEGKLQDIWNALQQDVAAIKIGGIVPDRTIHALLNKKNFKDLKGQQLIKQLEQLKGKLREDPQIIDNIDTVIKFVKDNPDKTYAELTFLGKGMLSKKGTALKLDTSKAIGDAGQEKMYALAKTLGKFLGMAAILTPAGAEAGEMAMNEERTKREK